MAALGVAGDALGTDDALDMADRVTDMLASSPQFVDRLLGPRFRSLGDAWADTTTAPGA
jgi:hypothetical protein